MSSFLYLFCKRLGRWRKIKVHSFLAKLNTCFETRCSSVPVLLLFPFFTSVTFVCFLDGLKLCFTLCQWVYAMLKCLLTFAFDHTRNRRIETWKITVFTACAICFTHSKSQNFATEFIYTQCGYAHYIKLRCCTDNNMILMCSSFQQGSIFFIGMIVGLSFVSVETKS
jgi:hypothetical protein